jgi:eukaryotic-like serine/threonine-protein kinase
MMDANRWKQIKGVYDRALDLSCAEREGFLVETCAGDADLRREIESLLAAHEDAGTFLQSPAVEVAAREIVGDDFTSTLAAKLPVAPQLTGRELANYKIISLLGKGGMGEVYLAEDKRLHRKVALKLLPLQFTNDADRVRRFEREAWAVSALNHPNIMTIFEIGQAGGLWFMATEFIEGQTLRRRLAAGEPMPPREVIRISAQIADALAAAHETGVVHRDIKPENVMLRRDGYVKVLDFGLAKVTERLTTDDHAPAPLSSLTAAGTVMGTVSYMSPEQARGQEMDERTDIFSLGVVMYEMLAGRLPFEGATASDMMASILRSEPPALAEHAPQTPAELEAIVMKALAKDREARWQKVEALADKLKDISRELEFKVRLADSDKVQLPTVSAAPAKLHRRAIGLAALAVLVLLLAVFAWQLKQPSEKPSEQLAGHQVKTLAVLPLRMIGVKSDEEYLGLVMAEALITRLSSIRQITVRPTEAVLRYQDGKTDSQAAGRELRVDAVLTGSLQKINDRVLVRVQLFRQSEPQPIWDREFPHTGADLFVLQSSIAEQVTVALALKLTGEERQGLKRRYTENTEAHKLYVQGIYFLHKRTTEGIRQAIEYFEQAVARDSRYAPAYVDLGLAWNRLAERNVVPLEEGVSKAQAAARRALEIDDTLSEAHSLQAILRLVYDWDVSGAERELQRAIELDPNNAMTLQWQGVHLLARGRADEAVAVTRRAFELNPVSLNVRSQLCRALYLAHRYDEAIAASQELIQMEANYTSAWAYLGQSYTQKGMHTEAVSALQKADSLAGVTGDIRAALGHAYAAAGRRDEAQKVIADLKTKPSGSGIPYHLATVYAALGQSDEACNWLTIAFDRHDPFVIGRFKTDPKLDPLRNDPRFNALLQRIEW